MLVTTVPDKTSIFAPVATRLVALVEMFEVLVTTVPDKTSIFAPVATRLVVLASILAPVATGIPAPISPETITISPLLVEIFEVFVTTVPERVSTIAPVATRLVALVEMFEVLVTTVPDKTSIFAPVATRLVALVEMFEVLVTTVPDKTSIFAPVATRLVVLASILAPVATGIPAPISPETITISPLLVEIFEVFRNNRSRKDIDNSTCGNEIGRVGSDVSSVRRSSRSQIAYSGV